MTHILRISTVQKSASLADKGNYAYCQSIGVQNNIYRVTFCNYIFMYLLLIFVITLLPNLMISVLSFKIE